MAEVRPILVIQGQPCVFEAILTNRSKEAITGYFAASPFKVRSKNNEFASSSIHGVFRRGLLAKPGQLTKQLRLSPSESVCEWFVVEQTETRLIRDRLSFDVQWQLHVDQRVDSAKLEASSSYDGPLPKPGSPEVAAQVKALLKCLDRPRPHDSVMIEAAVRLSKAADVFPLAVRLYQLNESSQHRLMHWAFDIGAPNQMILQEICRVGAVSPALWVVTWWRHMQIGPAVYDGHVIHADTKPPTREQMKQLCEHNNPLVRLAWWVCFGDMMSEEPIPPDCDLFRSMTAEQLAPWVERLDHRSYREREVSERTLISFGYRSLELLQRVVKQHPSTEVRDRAKRICQAIERRGRYNPDVQLLGELASLSDELPRAQELVLRARASTRDDIFRQTARRSIERKD